jgi:formiminoglutamase
MWRDEVHGCLEHYVAIEIERLHTLCGAVHLSIDADVVTSAEVPGVSAPNPAGLNGDELIRVAQLAGKNAAVTSLELVEINPRFDLDGRSARWGAIVVWQFLVGLARRQFRG